MTEDQIKNIMSSLTVDDMLILYAFLKVLEQAREAGYSLLKNPEN